MEGLGHRFVVTVDTDNASFQDGGYADALADVLIQIAARVEGGDVAGRIMDPNGNTVAEFRDAAMAATL